MGKIVVSILVLSSVLFSLDFNKAEDIVLREGKIYKKFDSKPFTGLGKLDQSSSDKCRLALAEIKEGKPHGSFEVWTCDGKLLVKGTQQGATRIGLFEQWNEEGELEKKVVHSKDGKIQNGFEKIFYNGKYLIDMVYKNGKKTGWKLDYRNDYSDTYKVEYKNGVVIKEILIERD